MNFGVLLLPSLVCFRIQVRKRKTVFRLHRRVRIAYPAVHETIALGPFYVDNFMFFQRTLLCRFFIDFRVILRGLRTLFLALWASFFEPFFTSALG